MKDNLEFNWENGRGGMVPDVADLASIDPEYFFEKPNNGKNRRIHYYNSRMRERFSSQGLI